jgi:thiamine-monophosphate kinase
MIDTSDGLLRDAGRVAAASGVVLDLSTDLLAPPPGLVAAAQRLGEPGLALRWVLTGGEDHALLGCFPPNAALPPSYRPIGRAVKPGDDGPGLLVDGRPWIGTTGWQHFA